MADIPEHLLRRSAEAKAKARGVPVEQVLAEMRGEEAPPAATPPPAGPSAPAAGAAPEAPAATPEVAASAEAPAGVTLEAAAAAAGMPAKLLERSAQAKAKKLGVPVEHVYAEMMGVPVPAGAPAPAAAAAAAPAAVPAAAPAIARPAAPTGPPEGVRTQRLLTVVKATAIQQVKSEPVDKVNTWPHLVAIEFVALIAVTAFLVVLSVLLNAPLLEAANFNITPNPSKAPWYFLGLQELLSYFDPQIAGVLIPGLIGLGGLMALPYIDRNPSVRPADRKFAIMMFTFFLMGAAVLGIWGILFRGPGFNFTYPWSDGVFFDDLLDWFR